MKQKDILLLLIPFSLVVILYIVFSIYHNIVTSTIPEVLNIQITPISPDFDQKTIMDIKNREKVTPIFEIGPAPQATGGAQIQTASGGATLK